MNFRLTLVLVIVLALVCSTYLGLKSCSEQKGAAEKSRTNLVFTPAPAGIMSVEYTQDGTLQWALAKSNNTWRLTRPVDAAADDMGASDVTTALMNLTYADKFEPAPSGAHSAETTGVAKARHVVKFTDETGKQHTLSIGKRAVSGVYATADGAPTIYLLESNPLDKLDVPVATLRSKLIKQISPETIEQLTIHHKDQNVTLVKNGNDWVISSPITARANAATIEGITNELRNVRAAGFGELPKDMPATGLNPPVMTVTAMVAEAPTSMPGAGPTSRPAGTPVTLELGYYTDPTSKKNVYASLAGSKEVFTLTASTFDKLNKELADLRDPVVLPNAQTEPTRIDITPTAGGTVSLSRTVATSSTWMLDGPTIGMTDGDPGAATALMTTLRDLRASKFVDAAGDLKSIGLDPPQAKVELTTPGQARHDVLLIGKPETADDVTPLMVQGEPTVYLVKSVEVAKLTPGVLELRDHALERLTADRIREIKVTGPGAAGFTLRRDGTSWKVAHAGGASDAVDEGKMTSLLADFTPLTAAKFLSTSPTHGGAPDMTVTVTVLEPSAAAATAPATTQGAASAPATMSAALQAVMNQATGPDQGKEVTRTLRLWKPTTATSAPATAPAVGAAGSTWQAVWEGGPGTPWTFEPAALLMTHLTATTYAIPATQPATQPGAASAPAEK